jgi:DUF177 domain-containing protein
VFRIPLERADTEPVVFDERIELDAERLAEDVVTVGPVAVKGTIERSGEGYVLSAEVAGSGQLRCARCLEPFDVTFREAVCVKLQSVAQAPCEEEMRLGREDLDVAFYAAPELDLAAIATEQLQLAVPMKPLCREACQGLCPHCGANRNTTRCGCADEEVDDRWTSLAEWRPGR